MFEDLLTKIRISAEQARGDYGLCKHMTQRCARARISLNVNDSLFLVKEVTEFNLVVLSAYLHRKEGDQGNAAYWYSRAGKPVCREPLDAEWLSIVKALVG